MSFYYFNYGDKLKKDCKFSSFLRTDIPEEELSFLFNAYHTYGGVMLRFSSIDSLKRTYDELQDEFFSFANKKYDARLRIYEHQELQRKIRAYLMEYDVFLNHWGTLFKEDDFYKDIFDFYTSRKYLDSIDYALLFLYRNYVVHYYDLPINFVYKDEKIVDYVVVKKWMNIDEKLTHSQHNILELSADEESLTRIIDSSYSDAQQILNFFIYAQMTPKMYEIINQSVVLIEKYNQVTWPMTIITDDKVSPNAAEIEPYYFYRALELLKMRFEKDND